MQEHVRGIWGLLPIPVRREMYGAFLWLSWAEMGMAGAELHDSQAGDIPSTSHSHKDPTQQ